MSDVLLRVENLGVDFALSKPLFGKPELLHAVQDVSFDLIRGETLSVVGESGSGKSTLARSILRLIEPSYGKVTLEGQDLLALSPEALRKARRNMQMIFQDPISSLSPRRTVSQIIEEPLLVHFPELSAAERSTRVNTYMDLMGLAASMRNRYPHEFSGGQAQRIGIARALIVEPELLIADEPVSALDVSIQAQVLELLATIKKERAFTMMFISHDLSVVQQVSDRLLVLYHGRIMEMGSAQSIYQKPLHPYTHRLLSAVPTMEIPETRGRAHLGTSTRTGCLYAADCTQQASDCRSRPLYLHDQENRLVAHHGAQAG